MLREMKFGRQKRDLIPMDLSEMGEEERGM